MSSTPPDPQPARPRLDEAQRLLAELQRVTPAEQAGAPDHSVRTVLDAYGRAVGALRAVAREARGRIERSAAIVAEARDVARRSRKRRTRTRRDEGR